MKRTLRMISSSGPYGGVRDAGPGRSLVIVGAGHAGGTLASLLRQQGWRGSVTLVGAEPYHPYQRPPLSKAWLKGELEPDALMLRTPSYYAEQGIALCLGQRVEAIDRTARGIRLADGTSLAYDILVLATGVRPRRLAVPGSDLAGIFTLRTLADADALRAALVPGRRLVIVGGGYIGLEVAAAARALGLEVSVVEREGRVLARVASPEISDFYAALHARHGVSVLPGAGVTCIEGNEGRLTAVLCDDGRRLDADLVLLGVGAEPESDLAQSAGLACLGGVVVDSDGATSDPQVFAIGDVTCRPLPRGGGAGRLESVQSALEQARRLALRLCGKPQPAEEVPWFWSDQYDVKLQIAGLISGAARRVVRGAPEAGRFAVFHLADDGVLLAVEAVNMPTEFMAGRQWIGQGRAPSATCLADAGCPIRDAA